MADVVRKYFYREVKEIITAINQIGIAKKVLEAAEKQDAQLLKQLVEQFEFENPELWERMREFYQDFWNENNVVIFSNNQNDFYQYNEEEFNCEDLMFLVIMSDEFLELSDLFLEEELIIDVIKKKGYNNVAEHLEAGNYFSTLEELLLVYKK